MMKDSSHLVISATSRVFFSYKCDTSKESYPFSYIKRTTFFLPQSGPDLRVDAHFFSTTIIKETHRNKTENKSSNQVVSFK